MSFDFDPKYFGFGLAAIDAEVQKCEVLCCNHHSIRTWKERHA